MLVAALMWDIFKFFYITVRNEQNAYCLHPPDNAQIQAE